MKLLEIPVWVHDSFESPEDVERFELIFSPMGSQHMIENGDTAVRLYSIPKSKPKYNWPGWIKDGTQIFKNDYPEWRICYPGNVLSHSFSEQQKAYDLPNPPENCEPGTTFVKGEA